LIAPENLRYRFITRDGISLCSQTSVIALSQAYEISMQQLSSAALLRDIAILV